MALSRKDIKRLRDEYNQLLAIVLSEQEQMAFFAALNSIDELYELANEDQAKELTMSEIGQLRRILNEFNDPKIRSILNKKPAILQIVNRLTPKLAEPNLVENKEEKVHDLQQPLIRPPLRNNYAARPQRGRRPGRSIVENMSWGVLIGGLVGVCVAAALLIFFPPVGAAIATALSLTAYPSLAIVIPPLIELIGCTVVGSLVGGGIDLCLGARRAAPAGPVASPPIVSPPSPKLQDISGLLPKKQTPLGLLKQKLSSRFEIPEMMQCPFTYDYPKDPVFLHGYFYERLEVAAYLKARGDGVLSPNQLSKLYIANLAEPYNKNNQILKNIISEFKEYHDALLVKLNIDGITDANAAEKQELAQVLAKEYSAKISGLRPLIEKYLANPKETKNGYQPGHFKASKVPDVFDIQMPTGAAPVPLAIQFN